MRYRVSCQWSDSYHQWVYENKAKAEYMAQWLRVTIGHINVKLEVIDK